MSHNPFSAVGPHYGHMVQETLMLKYLLEASDGDVVSLEYFDDVGIEQENGESVAIQSKSGISWNPVANRAKDLWKTLSNWISMVEYNLLDQSKTRFVLAIARHREGEISNWMKSARTLEDAENVMEKIKIFFGDEIPAESKEYIKHFFSADRELVKQVIVRFDIEIYNNPKDTILSMLRRHEEEKFLETIFDMLAGWLKNKIEDDIRNGVIPLVASEQFRKQLIASRRKLNQDSMLISYASEPSIKERDEHLARTYVRQLELIDCDMDEKIEAISCYIRSRSDIIKWADDGCVHGSSFNTFYESLKLKWKNSRRRVEISYKNESPEDRGKLILSECCEYREPLEGLVVPPHFTPGCFHECSNNKEIGWHYDFKKLLSEDKDE